MRSTILAIACGFGLLTATAAVADDNQTQPTMQTVAVQDNDPIICHTFVHQGEVTRGHMCLHKHEWVMLQHRDQNDILQYQYKALLQHQ